MLQSLQHSSNPGHPSLCASTLVASRPDPQGVLQALQRLLASGEYLVRHSQGRLATQRLVPASTPAPLLPRAASSLGTAIVTGGSKGLGLASAQRLAGQGLQCLVVAARTPQLSKGELIQLAERGTAVWTVQ